MNCVIMHNMKPKIGNAEIEAWWSYNWKADTILQGYNSVWLNGCHSIDTTWVTAGGLL